MSWLGDLQLLRPAWLLLLPVTIALVWWLRHPGGDLSAWQRIADPRLLAYLTTGRGDHRRRWPLVLLALAWLLAILALAGPVWDKHPLPLFRTEATRVVVLDLSRSMLATDLKPNRLIQARYKLADLLDRNDEGQIGLVAYAGESFVVSPLTQDALTIKAMLGALDVSIMPSQGSELGEALLLAGSLLERVDATNGEVILMTDSVGLGGLAAVEQLREAGHRLSVIGVGTAQGAPIPAAGGGFYKSSDGSIAVPRLDEAALADLASRGGGQYSQMRTDDSDLQAVLSLDAGSSATSEDENTESLQWRERGPWLVLLLLPLAAVAFRRGWLLVCVLAVAVAGPHPPAVADTTWDGAWLTPDQQAARALDSEAWDKAARIAQDPALRAEALYRAGEYEAAAQAWSRVAGAEAHYNRGNALAMQQDYQAAIEAYDDALAMAPEMEDALYNKSLLEELQQEQEQQQQQEQEQSDDQQQGENEQQSDSAGEEGSEEQSEPQPEETEGEASEEEQQPVAAESLSEEEKQSLEQWLRRIPDDPGGLLRRKFLLEYQRRGQPPPATEEEW